LAVVALVLLLDLLWLVQMVVIHLFLPFFLLAVAVEALLTLKVEMVVQVVEEQEDPQGRLMESLEVQELQAKETMAAKVQQLPLIKQVAAAQVLLAVILLQVLQAMVVMEQLHHFQVHQ
jgi:hypothetical protein